MDEAGAPAVGEVGLAQSRSERYWDYTASVGLLREVMEHRMFPLTLEGLDKAMRALTR